MCEIAMLDTDNYSHKQLSTISMTLYQAMNSSLGLVGVREGSERETFEYDIYKAVEPDRADVIDFIEETLDKGAIRLIIHGRMATHGAVNYKNAHPIKINCDECDVDYLLHNGVVGQHQYDRSQHEEEGHSYETKVDSEVIAHEYGTVPTTFDNLEDIPYSRQPSFILLNENAMFISGERYNLSEDFEMARRRRDFGPTTDEGQLGRVIVEPSGAGE